MIILLQAMLVKVPYTMLRGTGSAEDMKGLLHLSLVIVFPPTFAQFMKVMCSLGTSTALLNYKFQILTNILFSKNPKLFPSFSNISVVCENV